MRRTPSSLLGLFAALAVAIAIAGNLLPHPWLAYLFKPLATMLILTIALSNWSLHKASYALWITIGLFFCLIGDVALLWPSRYFIIGLAAFFLAHVAYLVAFTRDARFPARVSVWFFYLAFAVALFAFLLPDVPNDLEVPVALYAVLLASMAAQAMGRFLLLKTPPARLAAIGAILFMLSDLLLAFDRFHTLLLLAPILILIPYYLAQWLIAYSTASP